MERSYLIRYGFMGEVGRFAADADSSFEWGRKVVVRSHRGVELGEVLVEAPARGAAEPPLPSETTARVLRAADADDLRRADDRAADREARFDLCRSVFESGDWPIELIDIEPLLDDNRVVLHYLGPHHLDTASLHAAFRATTTLDVMLQPVGPDVGNEADAAEDDHHHGCGSCGTDGGCGTGGGGGCGTGGGCSSCGVQQLLASRR